MGRHEYRRLVDHYSVSVLAIDEAHMTAAIRLGFRPRQPRRHDESLPGFDVLSAPGR